MDSTTQRSGLACLRELLKKLRLNPDWDGIVTADMLSLYDMDSLDALQKITGLMDYQPEVKEIGSLSDFNGPALVLLKNNHYVCMVNCTQLSGQNVGLYNPRGQNGNCNIGLAKEQLLQIGDGRCLFFDSSFFSSFPLQNLSEHPYTQECVLRWL